MAGLFKIKAVLENEKPARIAQLDRQKKLLIDRDVLLLTNKKVIYVANVGEDDLATDGAVNTYV